LLVKGFGVNVRKIGKGVRDLQNAYEYCAKDGNYKESPDWNFFK